IEFLSRTQPTPGTTTVPALAEPAGTPVPLSFVQRRLWVESKLDAQNAAYNMRIALRIRGALERGLLQEALAMLIQRHAVLRTAFIERDGEAAQVVQEFVELPWRDLDLADRQPCARQEALTGELDRAGQTPFDLAIAPLLRVVLIKLEDREHVLLL